ncbi:hypothetical protein ACFOY2_17100 [Nonomuraea purpurea]|uniref:Uncharacterized protein n=1 Tax=Nonomuraea purpurea TaxID=1849276 RepID=A0ABV8G8I2_9ACTN
MLTRVSCFFSTSGDGLASSKNPSPRKRQAPLIALLLPERGRLGRVHEVFDLVSVERVQLARGSQPVTLVTVDHRAGYGSWE